MLRKGVALAVFAGAWIGGAGQARAEAWLASGPVTPVEQRLAIAADPGRTTLWTSLRFTAAASGKVAIVVPAPAGSTLDLSSDAWFEALEVATAPRIFPPASVDPFCPDKSGSANVFQLDGQISHAATLAPKEFVVLDDANAVITWATQTGLTVPPSLQAALSGAPKSRFVALRFDAPQGPGVTPTLRVVMPSAPPQLPLALTQAAGEDLQVTAWTIGPSRADLIGSTEVSLSGSTLAWNANDSASNYDDQRATALGGDASRYLIEAASHEALAQSMSIAGGTASIDSVVSTFFERAAAYGDGNFDAAACLDLAEPALASSATVATSCPHGALGVIDPAPSCTEMPAAGQTDPGALRCGPGADDLAIALSNLVPKNAWVTRHALVIPSGTLGVDLPVGFLPGPTTSPVLHAGTVDYSECNADGGTSTSSSSSSSSGHGSSSSSSSGGHGSSSGVIIHEYPGGGPDLGIDVDVDLGDIVDPGSYETGCSCSGPDGPSSDVGSSDSSCSSDTSATSGGCSSDTSGNSESCSSGSGDSESCSSGSGDSSGCDSGGGGDSCDSGGGGEGCDSGGGSGCSGGDLGKCSTTGTHRVRGPRFSILLVAALAVLAPLRRHGRKRRDEERAKRRRHAAR